jgi:hypothetical protein
MNPHPSSFHLVHNFRLKKLGQGGKNRPPDIILRDRNMVPAKKIPEPWPPITVGLSPPTLQQPSRRVARRT